jgi:hypothetical protein
MPYSQQQLASALDSHDKALVEWANRRKQREKQIQAALKALPAGADKQQQLQAFADLQKQWFGHLQIDLKSHYAQQDVKKFLPRLLEEMEHDQPKSCLWLKHKCSPHQHKQHQEKLRTSQTYTQSSQQDAQHPISASTISPSTRNQHDSNKDNVTNPSTAQDIQHHTAAAWRPQHKEHAGQEGTA